MSHRVLILCAGRATRWSSSDVPSSIADRPKQLVPVCGEPILHRTVRQVLERLPDADVAVVAPADEPVWRVPGARVAVADLDRRRKQADKFLSSRAEWSTEGRTVLLLGDVFFTDEAMDTILGHDGDWRTFARLGASALTGCDHRELFAFSLGPEHLDAFEAAARRCLTIVARGLMGGWSGGWQVHASMAGAPDNEVVAEPFGDDRGNITNVDDWTDDFDYPADWHRWCHRYAKAKRAGKAVPS